MRLNGDVIQRIKGWIFIIHSCDAYCIFSVPQTRSRDAGCKEAILQLGRSSANFLSGLILSRIERGHYGRGVSFNAACKVWWLSGQTQSGGLEDNTATFKS